MVLPLEHVIAGPCEAPPESRDFARLRGFGAQTILTTKRGQIPAEEIRAGDLLLTRAGRFAEVVWTDRLCLDPGFLRSIPALRPILLCAGDLGDAPRRNTVLSPEQLVWVPDPQSGAQGEFCRAADVTLQPDVYRHRSIAVTYVSILCEAPVIIEAEGLLIPLVP